MAAEKDRAPLSTEISRLEGEVGPHAHHPLVHFRFFEQLKQRNVFRVAMLYVVVCWLILDPVHVLFHMLDVPIWANRLVVVLMALGFPAVLIFAWVYEITPEGLKPTVEVPHGQSIRRLTGRRLDQAIIAVLTVALTYFIVDKFWLSKHFPAAQPEAAAARENPPRASAAPPAAAPTFSPPAHSIAVLPFVNMSGDKEQEYFSEGLTEELLNSLSQINELQVAARTSSFSFQEEHPDIATVAHKLNVGAVLEGSVRRSAHMVRITAQLVNAVSGFHVWSQTYDRNLGDILKLQTEIATAVASALEVTLLGNEAAKIELGGTRNPSAFDAYLRASKAYFGSHDRKDFQTAISGYTEAIDLDPKYAVAYAARSLAFISLIYFTGTEPASRVSLDKAQTDAHKALALAPDLGEGHLALGMAYEGSLDFTRATQEYERALTLAPGNARILKEIGLFSIFMGHGEPGLILLHRAVALDPLNPAPHFELGQGLYFMRRYREAIAAYKDYQALDPNDPFVSGYIAGNYYSLNELENALYSCENKTGEYNCQLYLAVTYEKLGRHADAETMLSKVRAFDGDSRPVNYSFIYAQWGKTDRALEWLETAMRRRDPNLEIVKMTPDLDPLRKDLRFQAIERALKFPE